MARRLARLRARVKEARIPVIYVNDNYGRWQSDFRRLTAHCRRPGARGKPIVDLLAPADDDYFVLKPKHSGFFSTALGVLLGYLGARTLVLTGMAGNICVLFTAHDAYMRDFRLVVPPDCTASETAADNRRALEAMRTVLRANVTPSARLRLARLPGARRDRTRRCRRGREGRRRLRSGRRRDRPSPPRPRSRRWRCRRSGPRSARPGRANRAPA